MIASTPTDIAVLPPSNDLPSSVAAWSGEWSGWAGQGRSCDLRLVIERLSRDEATLVWVRASNIEGQFSERAQARIHGTELVTSLTNGATLQFRMRNPDVVEVLWREFDGRWSAGVLSRPSAEGRRISERVPTQLIELGREIVLEMVTFKPIGAGPFPTVIFNHGSTGFGNDPSLFTSTVTSPALASFFNDRGWMVVFPQRRGRGKSDGLYDEGFAPDRSQYSDVAEHALPGVERALVDIDCILDHLLARADVDRERLVIGGHSRGGFLAVALAGKRPALFCGALNFAGGWVDDQGPESQRINPVIARMGATFPGPTLWLYADHDPYYSVAHSRSNFLAFEAAGGRGRFHVLETLPGQDGHHIVSLASLWGPTVDLFLECARCESGTLRFPDKS